MREFTREGYPRPWVPRSRKEQNQKKHCECFLSLPLLFQHNELRHKEHFGCSATTSSSATSFGHGQRHTVTGEVSFFFLDGEGNATKRLRSSQAPSIVRILCPRGLPCNYVEAPEPEAQETADRMTPMQKTA